jgi:prepilin-type N-terminal cleavage/methylation domain-containing protein
MKYGLHRGFTLIELSLVLVIIGLIVTGILVGRDLIHIAQIRRTVAQADNLRTAIRTFQLKYGQLPGDTNHATDFWAGANNGNNDGVIDGSREAADLFHHLLLANLVAGRFVAAPLPFGPDLNNVYPMAPIDSQIYALPAALPQSYLSALTTGVYVPVGTAANYDGTIQNHIALTGLAMPLDADTYVTVYGAFYGTAEAAGITVFDAYSIDAKLDDGLPMTGRIGSLMPGGSRGGSALACPDPSGLDGLNVYNLANTNWKACYLWLPSW